MDISGVPAWDWKDPANDRLHAGITRGAVYVLRTQNQEIEKMIRFRIVDSGLVMYFRMLGYTGRIVIFRLKRI